MNMISRHSTNHANLAAAWALGFVALTGITRPEAAGQAVRYQPAAIISEADTGNLGAIEPVGIALSGRGEIYVLDADSNSVLVFDANRRFARAFGGRGHSEQDFIGPIGLASSANGVIAISSGLDRVLLFAPDGRFIRNLRVRGPDGREFARPQGIAFTNEHELLVAEWSGKRIVRLDLDGSVLSSFPTLVDREAIHPRAVAVSPGGEIVVLDGDSDRVIRYDRDGRYLGSFGSSGDGPGELSQPSGLAVDRNGRIVVADTMNNRIQVFDRRGRFLAILGRTEGSWREISNPRAVAVDSHGDLYVADTGNGRVQVFRRPPGSAPAQEDR